MPRLPPALHRASGREPLRCSSAYPRCETPLLPLSTGASLEALKRPRCTPEDPEHRRWSRLGRLDKNSVLAHFRPACFSIDAAVFGAKSAEECPATVTVPALVAWRYIGGGYRAFVPVSS